MIYINSGQCWFLKNFTDGTQQIRFPKEFNRHNLGPDLAFTWLYENEAELVTLYYLVNYYRATDYMFDNPVYTLKVPYLPNARMDRVQEYFSDIEKTNPSEVFTLKYFAKFINDLHFDKVITFDVHSNVALSLIDNCIDWSPEIAIKEAMNRIKMDTGVDDLTICFPDFGAYTRYTKLSAFKDCHVVYGLKSRDWHTREIKSMKIVSDMTGTPIEKITTKNVLVIDDIISSGGTIAKVAKELLNCGVENIFCYCSHLENKAFDFTGKNAFSDLVQDGKIKTVYTTNSIYRGSKNCVKMVQLF